MKPPETDPAPRPSPAFEEPEGGRPAELHRALAARAATARPSEDCPAPDTLWRAVAGELRAEQARDLVDHTARCPVCAEAWRLAVELQRDLEREAPGATAAGKAAGPEADVVTLRPAQGEDPEEEGFWRPWLQTAALIALLAGAAVLLPKGLLEDRPFLAPSVERGAEAGLRALVPQDRPLAREGLVLRWSEPEPGLAYDVDLLWPTEGGTAEVLSVRGLEEPALPLPPRRLEALPTGSVLLWEVTARRDGEEVARSTFTLRLGD